MPLNIGSSSEVTWGYFAEAACQAATIWVSDWLRASTCWTTTSAVKAPANPAGGLFGAPGKGIGSSSNTCPRALPTIPSWAITTKGQHARTQADAADQTIRLRRCMEVHADSGTSQVLS